ncbi:hypothetical protein GCM10009655_12230 [Rhodoglobus aureus]|uniref:Uncharacterized protein n=1 Tax=Rhodoglobus aureus TaxID=191497 RepID=A0ABP4G5J9_9MICO
MWQGEALRADAVVLRPQDRVLRVSPSAGSFVCGLRGGPTSAPFRLHYETNRDRPAIGAAARWITRDQIICI